MKLLLPAGTAFVVNTIGSPAEDLLMVSLKQTAIDTNLLQHDAVEATQSANRRPDSVRLK